VARFVTEDGVGLHYEICAQGEPTLLYVPAWSDFLEGMRWTEPLAREGIGIVVYERRGTGRSERPAPANDNYSVERLSADAIELADSLGLERILGFASFDAAHQAVRLAAERPERMAGLALMGPLLAPVAERAMQVMWEGLIAQGMRFALRSVADLGLADLSEEERERWAQALEGHVGAEVLLAMWRSTDVAESRPFLDRIRCPALVLAGELNIAIPVPWARRVAERLPHGRLVEIAGAGAAIPLTHGPEARAAILDLVRDL
jgi:pimeloyl-ACP methyl ester carboxylesterase